MMWNSHQDAIQTYPEEMPHTISHRSMSIMTVILPDTLKHQADNDQYQEVWSIGGVKAGIKHPLVGTGLINARDPLSARKTQEVIRQWCIVEKTIDTTNIRLIAGADAAYSHDLVYASIVIMTFPELEFIEHSCAVREISFPYIPGLLSFREGPAVIEAFTRLTCVPDLIFLNGHGYAHPARIGIASHIGVVLDTPSIGIAQHLLTGKSAMPALNRGSTEPVYADDEIIGMAVRTRERAKPVYVSAGHKVDLSQAVDLVLRTTTTHRFPEPLRRADMMSRQYRKKM